LAGQRQLPAHPIASPPVATSSLLLLLVTAHYVAILKDHCSGKQSVSCEKEDKQDICIAPYTEQLTSNALKYGTC